MEDLVVGRSADITTAEEARAYYRAKIAGARDVTCCGVKARIFCPPDLTHVYSEEEKDAAKRAAMPVSERVTRDIGAMVEIRRFCLDRAMVMDRILPTISLFRLSTCGHSGNRVLYGDLADGRYMAVVLKPFAGAKRAHRLISAFPVVEKVFRDAERDPHARFPP